MLKKIIPLSLLASSSLLYADFSQQEFLYKDPRVMGMGGANTAIGGYSTALFYNPAGLINIKKSHGVEVELLDLGVSTSKNTQNLVDDLDKADGNKEIADVIQNYSGESFQIGLSDYSSVSMHMEDDFAWSIGLLAAADINLLPHANGGSNGLIEVHGRAYGGVALGGAYTFDSLEFADYAVKGKLTVGMGVKYITQKSYDANLDAAEVDAHSDDLGEYLQDTYEVDNSGVSIDLGVLYNPMLDTIWSPTIGLSIMNIGSMNFDNAYGTQPTTFNLGVSVSPKVDYIGLTLALDYVDITGAQQALVYDAGSATYKNEDITYEFMRHVRAGATVEVFDNSWSMMTVSTGIYQGAYTAGVDLQLAVLKLQATTYQEQLGAEMGQLEDRRYMAYIGIGW